MAQWLNECAEKRPNFVVNTNDMFPAIKGYYDKGQIFLSEDAPVSAKTNVIITFLPEENKANTLPKRTWGSLEGKIFVSDDFDDPVEDLKDYM